MERKSSDKYVSKKWQKLSIHRKDAPLCKSAAWPCKGYVSAAITELARLMKLLLAPEISCWEAPRSWGAFPRRQQEHNAHRRSPAPPQLTGSDFFKRTNFVFCVCASASRELPKLVFWLLHFQQRGSAPVIWFQLWKILAYSLRHRITPTLIFC